MCPKSKYWNPRFTINPAIARALMDIEAAKTLVENTPFPPAIEAELRQNARVKSTHFSTRIEGNKLTLKEAQEVIEKRKTCFHGRERDVNEVRNYWDALLKVEDWAARKTELSEDLIKRLHAIVEKGRHAKSTPYRDGQNVIRDAGSGGIVYLPPEAKDVPKLMAEMLSWIKEGQKTIPTPIIAALLHYQFVTIHPYYDGNGRTARLLATFILQRYGYGLNGFFSLEEYHARNLAEYYDSLAVHKHHNYYFGRTEADLTAWVEYFVELLAKVFVHAQKETIAYAQKGLPAEPEPLRSLERRARMVFALFAKQDTITAQDAAKVLGLSSRMTRLILKQWVEDGWLIVANHSNRARSYALSATYRKYIESLSAIKTY